MPKNKKDPCAGCQEKDSKNCRKCEHAASRALALKDVEDASRKVAVMDLEGDLPYDRSTYINHTKFYISRSIEDILIAGKLLLVIKEKEARGAFVSIVEDEIGIPHATAYRFMNAAAKAEKYPALDFSQLGKKVHVFTLLEAPEEDLKELESKGILAGRDIDELQRMSVKEMRDLIKELKQDRDSVTRAVEKEFKAEMKAMKKELDRLSPFDPEAKDASWALDQLKVIDEDFAALDAKVRKVVFDDRLAEHPEVMANINGIFERMRARVQMFDDNWSARMSEIVGG